MTASSHIGPGSWRIVLEATQARLTTRGRRGLRLLYAPPRVDGSFYLRPDTALAGFSLRLPLPSHRPGPPALRWESADLDRDPYAWLRSGHREVRAPVAGGRAAAPGEPPDAPIGRERRVPPALMRAPWLRTRPVTLRLFSEIRPAY